MKQNDKDKGNGSFVKASMCTHKYSDERIAHGGFRSMHSKLTNNWYAVVMIVLIVLSNISF